MAFKLALLWAFVLLIRPQDFFPVLQSLRPALILTALATLALVFSKERRIRDAIKTPDGLLYLLFLAVGMIGIPFSYHRGIAFQSVVFVYSVNVLFFLVLVSEVDTLKRLKALFFIICCGALGFSALGVARGGWTSGRFEIPGSMFDPNDVGYILVTLIPFSAFIAMAGDRPLIRLVGVAACGTSLALVSMTGSRGALLGLATIGTVMFLTNKARLKPTTKLGILALIAIAVVVSADKINMERYLSLFELRSDYNLTDEQGRIEIWARGMDLLLAHPVLGVGMNCFPMALGMMREGMGVVPVWQVAHNSFVQVAAETGLLGFGVFILMNIRCLAAFLKASRLSSENAEATELRLFGGLMSLAFLGHLVAANFLTQGYSVYFTLLFAVGAILRRLQTQIAGRGQPGLRAEEESGASALESGRLRPGNGIPRRPLGT